MKRADGLAHKAMKCIPWVEGGAGDREFLTTCRNLCRVFVAPHVMNALSDEKTKIEDLFPATWPNIDLFKCLDLLLAFVNVL